MKWAIHKNAIYPVTVSGVGSFIETFEGPIMHGKTYDNIVTAAINLRLELLGQGVGISDSDLAAEISRVNGMGCNPQLRRELLMQWLTGFLQRIGYRETAVALSPLGRA